MKRLRILDGSRVESVSLAGGSNFRVEFPGGDVDVVGTTDGDYWVHIRVNTPERCDSENEVMGKLVDARLDISGKHAGECDEGDFNHPGLYHLAVRVVQDRGGSV
jgi:hypothetical protein